MRAVMIEVGHWHAKIHARSFQLGGAEIVAVSDHQPGVAERFAAALGEQVDAYRDYGEMLKAVQPEFVVALGRHVDMPDIARTLLMAGIPFAIEKPAGLSAEQVAPLVELAQQRGAFVSVPLVNRYNALWRWLEDLERAGRVGPRVHAHFRIVNGPPSRYERDGVPWMLDPAISGGGALRNLGIHAVDAFLSYAGGEDVAVLGAAVSYRAHGRDVEEMGAAVLRSESGIIGTVEAGYTYPAMQGGDYEWRVAATNCTLIDRGAGLQVATLDDGQCQRVDSPDSGVRYDQFGTDTLNRLEAGQRPIATLEDCYRAMCVLDEIYRVAVRTPYEQDA